MSLDKFDGVLYQNLTSSLEQEDAHEFLMLIFGMFSDYARDQVIQKPKIDFQNIIISCLSESEFSNKNIENKRIIDINSSVSTMSSSILSQKNQNQDFNKKKINMKSLPQIDENIGNENNKIDKSPFEGLMNPFTGIYCSKFTCLNCKYSWDKNEIRYVLSVS